MESMKYLLPILWLVVTVLLLAAPSHADDVVIAKDKYGVSREYFTGYVPTPEQYKRAQFRDFRRKHLKEEALPKELDLRPYVQRIRRQTCGDCWAQGAMTIFEMAVSFYDKKSIFGSVQDVIDCSGFGSCNGGQLSVAHFVKPKGVIYEADYPYKGHNQKCKSAGVAKRESAESAYFIRPLTPENIRKAAADGAFIEVCGSARALGNGGWVSTNPSGGTDHCYGYVGFFDGAAHGKPEGTYDGIANSWGSTWGENGFGFYRSKSEEAFGGAVITEAQAILYKPACTPQPVADGGPDKMIVVK